MNSKDEELKFSNFFVQRLNNHYRLNYKVVPNKESNSDVDIYAVSENNNILQLQLVTLERRLREAEGDLQKRAIKDKKKFVYIRGRAMNLDLITWIEEAIQKKEIKYPENVKKELVLLITGEIGPLINISYARESFFIYRNSAFKGIYLVRPSTDYANTGNIINGQIIAIKDIIGNHGEIF